MKRILIPVGVALLLAACSGSDNSGTPTPTVDFASAASQAAEDARMTLTDLPEFWTVGMPEDANVNIDLSPGCDIFDPGIAFPESVLVEQSDVFLGRGEQQASFVTAVFREESDAIAALESQDALVERCRDEFLEAMEQAARDEAAERGVNLGSLADIEVGIEETDFASLGDDTQARRASVVVSVVGVRTIFDADIVVVRSGRMMGAMTYSNFQFIDEEEEEMIARNMTDRLAAADASLPE